MSTWYSDRPPPVIDIGAVGMLRAIGRGFILALLVFACFFVLLVLRLIERPLFGQRRPVTPWITVMVCRGACLVIGLRRRVIGTPMRAAGAMVANHASWLDIFTLNACAPLYFVSKSDVRNWPAIGWLARGTGTVFISRDRRDAKRQEALLSERLASGHRLLFFPEGTSSDGRRVLPFKSTLFSALTLGADLHIQPVSVVYEVPDSLDPRTYGWWGDMTFGDHLFAIMSLPRRGSVTIEFHSSVAVDGTGGRKALAATTERAVRAGVDARVRGDRSL